MKAQIHPQYHENVKVTCACGNTFTVGSTKKELAVELCYDCHPFYTGKEKVLDTAGKVEKFKARQAKAGQAPEKKTKTRAKKQTKK
ncbi:MAG: 50S ribosomal protein L31 [Patescibacteria group bacterium]